MHWTYKPAKTDSKHRQSFIQQQSLHREIYNRTETTRVKTQTSTKSFYTQIQTRLQTAGDKRLIHGEDLDGRQLELLFKTLKTSTKKFQAQLATIKPRRFYTDPIEQENDYCPFVEAYEQPDPKQSFDPEFSSPFNQRIEEIQREQTRKRSLMTLEKLKRQIGSQATSRKLIKHQPTMDNDLLERVSERIAPMLMSFSEQTIKQTSKPKYFEPASNMFGNRKIVQKNHVEKNITSYTSDTQKLRDISKSNKPLILQNIPSLMKKTQLSRYEIHSIYALYKSMQTVISYRQKGTKIANGIDFETFCAAIPHVNSQSKELALKIYNIIDNNFTGTLSWSEFLHLMSVIKSHTIAGRVDLFVAIADRDRSGTLTQEEIRRFCQISLIRYLPRQESRDLLNHLCHYFTQLIFDCLGKNVDQVISFDEIKQAIEEERKGWEYLCLFCGADT